MYHLRKTEKRYLHYPKSDGCDFCDQSLFGERHVEESTHCYIVKNRTFYDFWELRKVHDHLLLIPKRHVHNLTELTAEERADIMNLIAKYESNSYNVYARGVASVSRSVDHQHTHLIKTDDKQARGAVFLRRPYWLWRF